MRTKKKILMTTSFYPPYHVGGDAIHVKYLAEALVKEGHEVHVLFSIDAYNFKRKEKKEVTNWNGVKVHILKSPLGKLEPVLNYCFGSQRYTYNHFKKLIETEKFDVVHHHNISLLGYDILKKIGNYKNIYTAHDYWLICHRYDLLKNEGKICDNKTCFSCCVKNMKPYQFFRNFAKFKESINDMDLVIAPSKFMKSKLDKEIKKVKVIYNFVPNPGNVKSYPEKDYFLYAGVLEKHKGILPLIEVFKELKDKKLLIVGKGNLEEEIKDSIKGSDNITFLGFKNHDELFPIIKSANALIIPSQWAENMPLIAIESLTLGTPVIGSNLGGIHEIIEKIDEKLIFKDFNELKKIILEFKENNKNKLIGIFEDNFSVSNFIKIYGVLIK